jgi:hypothetical protein
MVVCVRPSTGGCIPTSLETVELRQGFDRARHTGRISGRIVGATVGGALRFRQPAPREVASAPGSWRGRLLAPSMPM